MKQSLKSFILLITIFTVVLTACEDASKDTTLTFEKGAAVDLDGDNEADGYLVDEDGNGTYEGVDTNNDGTVDIPIDLLAGEDVPVDMDDDNDFHGVNDGVIVDADNDGKVDGIDTDGDGIADIAVEYIDEEYHEEELNDEQAVDNTTLAATMKLADGDTMDSVTQNIVLPTTGANDTLITWASNNPDVIATDGTVIRPVEADATVVLTATVTKNELSTTITFTLTVKKENGINPALSAPIPTIAEGNSSLTITWVSIFTKLTPA